MAKTLWSCRCGALNKSGDRQCEACGKPRSGGVQTEAQQPTPTDWQCTWLEGGRQCLLPGSIGTKSPRCTWHSHVADHPRLGEEFDEFERWIIALLEAKVCAVWVHYTARVLWRWVHGHHEPAFASPCAVWRCEHRASMDDDRTAVAGAGAPARRGDGSERAVADRDRAGRS